MFVYYLLIGAFLLPYGVLAVLCGIPLFLLEISFGQYTQEGFITCWKKLCPLAQGEILCAELKVAVNRTNTKTNSLETKLCLSEKNHVALKMWP